MTSVTFPITLGGDGSTVTDDSNPSTGLGNGGHRIRFLTSLTNLVSMCQTAVNAANTAVTSPASLSATSGTTLTIGTGSKSFTLAQTGKLFLVGSYVVIAYSSGASKYMFGQITAFTSATGAMTVNVLSVNGSGTWASWNVSAAQPNFGLYSPATGALGFYFDGSNVNVANALNAGTVNVSGNASITGTLSFQGLKAWKGANSGTVAGNIAVTDDSGISGALVNVTTGFENTVFGRGSAGSGINTGFQNAGFGFGALSANQTGNWNAAFGAYAIWKSTGEQNTAVGAHSNESLSSTGSNNTTVGAFSGAVLTTGSNNIFIGQNSGIYVTTGSNNVIVGSYTGNSGGLDIHTASNYVVIADGAGNFRFVSDVYGNIGLGGTLPQAWTTYKGIDLNGGSVVSGAGNDMRVTANTYWNGTNWIYKAAFPAAQYLQNAGTHYWYNAATGTAGTTVTFNQAMTLDTSGYLLVGYGSSNGAYRLQINGQIFATSSTIATSDGRYKENVTPLANDGALDLVCALRPVHFDWKPHPVHQFDNDTHVGFIAQEVQEAFAGKPYLQTIVKRNDCVIEPAEYKTVEIEPAKPEVLDEQGNVVTPAAPAVTEQRLVKEAVTEEFLGIAEGNLIALLTAAIQEQQATIRALSDRITALEQPQV